MNDNNEQFSVICPYCGKGTYVFKLTDEFSFKTREFVNGRLENLKKIWWAGTCRVCNKPMLVINNGENVYPTPEPEPCSESIPEGIRSDLDEARLCYVHSAFKGCALLTRRAVENACVDNGAKGSNLEDKIDSLYDKDIITISIRDWAHNVRWVGNNAAHIKKNIVNQKDAEDSLKLAESIMQVLYVIPQISNDIKSNKETSKKIPVPPEAVYSK